jgi:hypothetical protein
MSKTLTQTFNPNDQYRPPNDYAFKNDQNIVLRNLLILPCDDGEFRPDWNSDLFKYSPPLENKKVSTDISLNLSFGQNPLSNKNITRGISRDLYGVTPVRSLGVFWSDKPGSLVQTYREANDQLTNNDNEDKIKEFISGIRSKSFPKPLRDITDDNASNQIVIFEISNLFYGKFIKPGTFSISDSQLLGSSDINPVSVHLKDDGMGGLYRADSLGEHARWNTVGRIFYNEGIVLIKNPHLFFFGKSGFEVSFSGEQNIHTLKIEVIAPQNALNLSSNDPDQKLLPSNDPSDKKTGFVYITGLNFHDKNYNVVAKTQLAQPIVKRHEDKIMFRVQMDF